MRDSGSFITPVVVIATMTKDTDAIHLGREHCVEQGSGPQVPISFAELVVLLLTDPERLCNTCIRTFTTAAVLSGIDTKQLAR